MTAKECPESGERRALRSTLALWARRIVLIAIAGVISILSGLSLVMRFFGGPKCSSPPKDESINEEKDDALARRQGTERHRTLFPKWIARSVRNHTWTKAIATGCGFFFFWRGKSSARGPGSKKCNVNEVIVIDFASRTSILLLNGRAKSWLSRPLVNPQQPRN